MIPGGFYGDWAPLREKKTTGVQASKPGRENPGWRQTSGSLGGSEGKGSKSISGQSRGL